MTTKKIFALILCIIFLVSALSIFVYSENSTSPKTSTTPTKTHEVLMNDTLPITINYIRYSDSESICIISTTYSNTTNYAVVIIYLEISTGSNESILISGNPYHPYDPYTISNTNLKPQPFTASQNNFPNGTNIVSVSNLSTETSENNGVFTYHFVSASSPIINYEYNTYPVSPPIQAYAFGFYWVNVTD